MFGLILNLKAILSIFDDEPNEHSACVTVLCPGSYMHQVIDGDIDKLSVQFEKLIDKTEFWFERFRLYNVLCL